MPLHPQERYAIVFVLRHLAYGIGGAVTFGVCLLAFDIGGMGSLVLSSDHGVLAVMLLFGGLMVTFGGVAIGVGVMTLGEDQY